MNIEIVTIPHDQHRYTTAGDWFFDANGNLIIRVSDLGDWKREALLAIHELVEVLICKSDGVTQEQVDAFDFAWTDDENEPGDSPLAPYWKQHRIAMGIENLMAGALGVDWKAYEKQLEELPEVTPKK